MARARKNKATPRDQFHLPGELSTLRSDGRRAFIEAIHRVAPHVIDHLRTVVLPRYRFAVDPEHGNPTWGPGVGPGSRWGPLTFPEERYGALGIIMEANHASAFDPETGNVQVWRSWSHSEGERWVPTAVALTVPEEHREAVRAGLREVEALLLEWAQQFHLAEAWILDDALATIRYWAAGSDVPWIYSASMLPGTPAIIPPASEGGQWAFVNGLVNNVRRAIKCNVNPTYTRDEAGNPILTPSMEEESGFGAFDLIAYDPASEGRSAAKKRLMAALDRQVDMHLDQMAARARAAGFETSPRPRAGKRKGKSPAPVTQHYEWLAYWQVEPVEVKPLSKKKAASHFEVTSDHFTEQIEAVAELIGVSIRRGRVGRHPEGP